MKNFTVWAPKAEKLEICIEDQCFPMQKDEKGFWSIKLKHQKKSVLYAFKIDNKGPYPDPQSPFQPDGVHGKSLRQTPEFPWTDLKWQPKDFADAVIYELHTGTFSPEGNFDGIISRLDYLRELGITHIELMPVAAFPGKRGWGYDGVALFAPHNNYGSPAELKKLVNSCHEKGIAIILDVVYNHLGPDGNYIGLYGPYFSKRYHTPWGDALNFDWAESDQVRSFIMENALMWLRDFHFDGLRLDAVHAIYDNSAIHILEELQNNVDTLSQQTGKPYCLIAESDLSDPKILHSRDKGGYGLKAQWLDDFHHSLHVLLTGEKQGYYLDYQETGALNKCLNRFFVYDGCYSPFRRRRHGRSAKGLSPQRFVVFTQNHDQVGNRGLGERLCHLTSFENCQIAAAIMLLSPFVPMLFQGEEWAATTPFLYFTDHVNARLAKSVREGRRREYAFLNRRIPDPQAEKTFARSILNWQETGEKRHSLMLQWYKDLIRLRKKYLKRIRKADCSFMPLNSGNELFLYDAGPVSLLLNIGKSPQTLRNARLCGARILLQNRPVGMEKDKLTVEPGSALIFQIDN